MPWMILFKYTYTCICVCVCVLTCVNISKLFMCVRDWEKEGMRCLLSHKDPNAQKELQTAPKKLNLTLLKAWRWLCRTFESKSIVPKFYHRIHIFPSNSICIWVRRGRWLLACANSSSCQLPRLVVVIGHTTSILHILTQGGHSIVNLKTTCKQNLLPLYHMP